jgi:diguanylate cyclase (GGDEF)-like protein/PAS domain S-box-containing protein
LNAARRRIEAEGVSMPQRKMPQPSPEGDISFRQIAEMANDIVIVTTPELALPGPRIVYVNPAFTRLTGYTSEEAVGQTPRMLQGPGTSKATLNKISKILRAGGHVHEKVLNYAKGGAPYWLDLRIVPLYAPVGRITYFAAIERDVTLDKRRLDELEYLADRDTLTGIPNRRALLRGIEDEIETVQRLGNATGPCVAFIDVDNFKDVNDVFGHTTGDAVLYGVADRLAENIRRSDILGRLGGEEFGVCMPAVSLSEAKALAERLRRSIAGAPFETPGGPISITVSIGVAAFKNDSNLTQLIERADAAMYAAKRQGRNRVRA